MKTQVAVAKLSYHENWLLQLRDERSDIIAPGCWGLFGGHLEENETPEQAVHRELLEEINWHPSKIDYWFKYETRTHKIHVFKGIITVPIDQLKLLEGQDIKLASQLEIRSGKVWSVKLGEFRNTAPILNKLIAKTYEK